MKYSGANGIHILTDFDRTLSYSVQKDGTMIPPIISVLRDRDYLSPEYSLKAKALFAKYNPIEINSKISIHDKKESMKDWWNLHNELLMQSKINKRDLERIVDSGVIRLRYGVKELFGYTNKKQIPLVIMSSSGLGDTISMILKQEGILYNNIYIITNEFKWDKDGNISGLPSPVIHCMNKDETSIRNYKEVYDKIKNRRNVILIGDSIGDLGMSTGFKYDNLIKVGFLNPNEKQNKSQYENCFDIVITGDSDITPVNKLIEEIAE